MAIGDRFAHVGGAQRHAAQAAALQCAPPRRRRRAAGEGVRYLAKSYTWADFHERAQAVGAGLRKPRRRPGDTVAIIGDNRPDWMRRPSPRTPRAPRASASTRTRSKRRSRYLVDYAEAKVVIAEDEEQVDKMLRVSDRHPVGAAGSSTAIRAACANTPIPGSVERDTLLEAARKTRCRQAGLWDGLVDQTAGDDVAVLCSTSGTTSNPKLAMLTAGAASSRTCASYLRAVDLGARRRVRLACCRWRGSASSSRPLSAAGVPPELNFVEEPDTVMADIREIGPTFMFLAPRVWEQIAADVRAQIMDASPFKRRMFAWA